LSFAEDRSEVAATLHAPSPPGLQPDSAECLAQIERMVSSTHLQGSDALCKLLHYLAHHTLNFPSDHLKEYKIATELFGRPKDFDPQSDASIRVQIGRLRNKIADYNSTAGIDDPIVVDLPKGKHALSFQPRAPRPMEMPAPEPIPVTVTKPHRRRVRSVLLPLAIAFCALLVCGAVVYAVRSRAASHVPVVYSSFWGPFLHGPNKVFVVYANANFIGTADTGMRYFDPLRDAQAQISQHYTGVGEVMGVLELQRLFQRLGGNEFRVKRSGLFTLDDARDRNLIFVGSPTENLTLKELPNTREFEFKRRPAGTDQWQEVIEDLHPHPGEASVYIPTPQTRALETDYAVVALTRGLGLPRWTLMLAGISTVGTQAAVDFVCDEGSLSQLMHRLSPNGPVELKPFEALLRIKVANDVPLQSDLVLLRQTDESIAATEGRER
jgi:hypothetical protein